MSPVDMSPGGVYFLIVCAGTLWVAFDARRFDWHRNQFCDRVWKWVVGCVFLFVVALPAYLWQRRSVPAKGNAGFTTATPTFSSRPVEASSAGAAAVERAAAELATSSSDGCGPDFATPAYAAPATKPPLLVQRAPATVARGAAQGSLGLALSAGAGAAFAGGLLWAGVVIVTRWDIGIVAWVVGAATGGTVLRVFGGPVSRVPRMARITAGALVAAVLAAVATSIALAAQSPKQRQNAILAAALARHSVHWVQTDHAKTSGRMVCDVANDRGIQRISITKDGRTGHVTVLVVNRTAYIRGDAFAMHAYMGFSSAEASRYHGRWISIPHSFPTYGTVAAAVTLPSLVHHLRFSGSSLIAVTGTFDGRKVIGVRRHARFQGLPTVETLYARARGAPLPVAVVQVAASKGYRDTLTLSHWNETVRVSAPAHSVPIATVVAG